MTTVHIVDETWVAPDRVLENAHDFSPRRADVFQAVSVEHMEVHELGEESADVTEGTRAGPTVVWERCDYDWSQPGSVKATVTDSNVYDPEGSSWEITAAPKDGGSRVEMIWARNFKRNPRGLLFGTAFRTFGNRIFAGEARKILKNMEKLEQSA